MRNLVVALCVVVISFSVNLSVSVPAVAEETEMDMDLMQTIEETNDSLSSNIALEDGEAAAIDAQLLTELFAVVEAHYKKEATAGNDVAEAVKLSTKSVQLTVDILGQVNAGDFESAANAATDLSRTCKTCHNFYKED